MAQAVISPVIIATLVSAYKNNDNETFEKYSNFIADVYEETGDFSSASMIRELLNGYVSTVSEYLNKESLNN
jgi:hypothetical protein